MTAVLALAYLAAHELTHGLAIRALSGARPTYRVHLPYLTTGSTAYLTRRAAIAVALAPLVAWGFVLSELLVVVPRELVLSVYVIAALNVAGSTGDLFQAAIFARLPRAALVQDSGDSTALFLPRK